MAAKLIGDNEANDESCIVEGKEKHMAFDKGRCGLRGAGKMPLGLAALAAVFLCGAVGISAEEPASPAKIAMRILYAGQPCSQREKDFVEFLNKNFTQVQTGNLGTFNDKNADGFDVTILDYPDDRALGTPRWKLSQNYTHATVTIGVVGALIGNQLRLKTGFE